MTISHISSHLATGLIRDQAAATGQASDTTPVHRRLSPELTSDRRNPTFALIHILKAVEYVSTSLRSVSMAGRRAVPKGTALAYFRGSRGDSKTPSDPHNNSQRLSVLSEADMSFLSFGMLSREGAA